MLRRAVRLICSVGLLWAASARAITLPPGFVSESASPGATFLIPTAIAFTPTGRILVTEKRGRVYAIGNGVKEGPLLDITAEVLENGDRGLLGIAVDPNFAVNRYVYLLYTVDPDSNGVDTDNDAFGRLARFQMSSTDSAVIDPASRTILLGATWRTGIPRGSDSHSEGALRWGRDGSLLVSCGEGAQYTGPDAGGQDPGLFGPGRTDPIEDIGAFRAQYLASLGGKVLRLDPATGHGYPSNPFYNGDATSNRSRVWAYGLRNPFRFTVRPGTGSTNATAGAPGTLYIGDVGWITYEDLNIARTGGKNFGWPCFEGMGPSNNYQSATPAHESCSSIGTPSNPSPHTPPVLTLHHISTSLSSPVGAVGNSIIGGAFYTADRYPSEYWGAYFFSDFGQNWVRVATFDANDELVSVTPFATDTEGAVDWVTHPLNGDLYSVGLYLNEVRRLRYVGPQPNRSPGAVASGSPKAGARPLLVNFSSAGSNDPDGDALAFSWLFGDGSGASGASASHVYNFPGHYLAILTADDQNGGEMRDTIAIVVTATGVFPTTSLLDSFNRVDGPLGASWLGASGSLTLDAARVASSGASAALWSTAVGADQEAFVTLGVSAPGTRVDVLLKSQSDALDAPRIRVRHEIDAALTQVSVWDAVAGWVQRGSPLPGALTAGQ
ncbi:MAG: PQQ-dependent sugar dehydrogenase, partial [Candidatus Eisenbacteria bacterium]